MDAYMVPKEVLQELAEVKEKDDSSRQTWSAAETKAVTDLCRHHGVSGGMRVWRRIPSLYW